MIRVLGFGLFLCGAAVFFVDGLRAQSPATAIVNALVVDGSGNEPFVGTVLFADGRITQVGRTVTVPPDARTIDGQGRTIVPGFFDLRIDASAPAGSASSGPSSASAGDPQEILLPLLYSGVTTAVIFATQPTELDVIRRAAGTADVPTPRLLFGLMLPAGATGGATGGDAATPLASLLPDAGRDAWRRLQAGQPDALLIGAEAWRGGTIDRLPPETVAAVSSEARANRVRVFMDLASADGVRQAADFDLTLMLGGAGDRALDASAATSLRQRNATYVPMLSASAPADQRGPTPFLAEVTTAQERTAFDAARDQAATPGNWQARRDTIKALQAAGVRLAVGSNSQRTTRPLGWSTLQELRLLVDAGLTPLQAITAATSGSAWALGLQSDRGFIAVGQRADLVVINGNPIKTIAELERIERVFTGGREVPRDDFRARLTRATSTSTSAPTLSDPTPAPTTPAPTTATPSSPEPKTSAPKTTAPASLTSSSTSPAAPTTSTGSSSLPTVPAPRTSKPLEFPPTASSPSPSATPPASPAPARSDAAGATTETAVPSVTLSEPMIADFERDGNQTARGLSWNSVIDPPGNQPTTMVAGRVIRGLRDHALTVAARMGSADRPYARIVFPIAREGETANVSRYRGIRFDARGEGRYRIIFVTRRVQDGRFHESYFSGSPLWTPVSIPFASLGQTKSKAPTRWTGHDLVEIIFEIARDAGNMGWLELDNVRFYGS